MPRAWTMIVICFLYHSILSTEHRALYLLFLCPELSFPISTWLAPSSFTSLLKCYLARQMFSDHPLSNSPHQPHNALLYASLYISSAWQPYVPATILNKAVLRSDDHLIYYIELLITHIYLPSLPPQTEEP